MKLSEFLKNFNLKEKYIISYSGNNAIKKVKQTGHTLEYVKEQTPAICIAAVKENIDYIQGLKDSEDGLKSFIMYLLLKNKLRTDSFSETN